MTISLAEYDFGLISRELATVARELAALTDHITGRNQPRRPQMPVPFKPPDDDDTYQRLLAFLLGRVDHETRVEWGMTNHWSVVLTGTLVVNESDSHDCVIGCRLSEDAQFWIDRHELFDLTTLDCGCVGLYTVGGRIVIGEDGCDHDVDDDEAEF
jgi:hypothetical protein